MSLFLIIYVPLSGETLFPFGAYNQEQQTGGNSPQNKLTCSSRKGLLWLCAVLKVVHMIQMFFLVCWILYIYTYIQGGEKEAYICKWNSIYFWIIIYKLLYLFPYEQL